MSRLAFVFPGQGAQYPGMGKEMAMNYPEAARVFDQAEQISAIKLRELCFFGPADILNTTEFAQPALLTTSLAILAVVQKQGIQSELMAGLSLGEYTALVAAGSVTFAEALPLVQTRGRLMQNAVPQGAGAMIAVMGIDYDTVFRACEQAGGIVDIANINCPGQVVISGEREAVLRAGSILREKEAKIRLLEVSVPSHSQLMTGAAHKLGEHLQKIAWENPTPAVISNVTGQEHVGKEIPDLLVKQLYSPVQWEASIRYMAEKVDYFIGIGPGNSLAGLVKRTVPGRWLGNIQDIKSLEKVMKEVEKICRKE